MELWDADLAAVFRDITARRDVDVGLFPLMASSSKGQLGAPLKRDWYFYFTLSGVDNTHHGVSKPHPGVSNTRRGALGGVLRGHALVVTLQ